MLKTLFQSIKSNWKRTLSGLLAVITILGMLPATALAAERTDTRAAVSTATPVYAPTGDFEVNIAGATGWNGTCLPLPVYNAESGGSQAADGKSIPDVTGRSFCPNARQFSSRLSRYEYVVPCMFTLAERLAKVQQSAISNGETLVIYETFRPAGVQDAVRDGFASLWDSDSGVSADMDKAIAMGYARNQGWFIAKATSNHQAGLAVDMSLAKGDPAELHEYTLDGAAYRKYEDWTEYEMPTRMHELSSAAIRFQTPVSSYTMPSELDNWTERFAASEGAKRLQGYCTAAGLIPLSSEWWHFNDPNVAKIMAKGSCSGQEAVNTKGGYTIDRAYSTVLYVTLTKLTGSSIRRAPVKANSASSTGGTGGLNPGSAGGQKPTTSNVDWAADPERTFLRFTLIEFPEGVVKEINNNDCSTWHVVGTPLNVVWSDGTYENWSAEQCRSKITWFNSCAMQYNGKGANAAQMMAGGTGGVYAYDATNGFTEADSFVDSITKAAKVRDTIFSERRSYGLHILSPFNFERPEPTGPSLEVTKKAGGSIPAGETWSFTVTYTAGSPASFTAKKNGTDCTSQVTSTGSGLKFTLKADETIRIEFEADASFRFDVTEDDTTYLTDITGTGGTADMSAKKFTGSGGASKVTFTNGTTITEKKPVYLKLKKIAAADKRPLSGAEFSVYADSSCSGTPLASPFTVTCKAPENSTAAGVVQAGPASGIENGGIPEPGKALLFKRDALTNTGVGPATFKFSSVTNGVYEFDTDEAGVLESVQW